MQGVETQIFSYPQFKFWFRFEGDCDPGGFTSERGRETEKEAYIYSLWFFHTFHGQHSNVPSQYKDLQIASWRLILKEDTIEASALTETFV